MQLLFFFRALQPCLLTDDFVSNLIKKLENGSVEWPPISLLVPINLSVTPVTAAWFSPGVSHLLGLLVDLALLVNASSLTVKWLLFPMSAFLVPSNDLLTCLAQWMRCALVIPVSVACPLSALEEA